MSDKYRITIMADKGAADAVESLTKAHPDQIELKGRQQTKDATRLGFDLGDIASVVTLVTSAFYFGELAAKLYRIAVDSKSNKIVVQTPVKTIEIKNAPELTVEKVQELLKAAIDSGM